MSGNKLYGLVLAGGKSLRMGKDKGVLQYHNLPQREHAFNLLNILCDETFYSIRPDQKPEFDSSQKIIIDNDEYKGPYNGIMSAHQAFPDVAWIILATDLPLLEISDISKLIENRNENKIATAFATSESNLPEPLVAIWEIEGLKRSKKFLKSGNGTCPRKFLIINDVELVFPDNDQVLMNANTISDFKEANEKLLNS